MTAFRLAATASLAVLAALAPVPAHAAAPLAGRACDLVNTNHPPGGGNTWIGTISGGPIAAPGATVTLTCSVHLDNNLHSGPAVVAESSVPGPGVAVLEPRVVTYEAELFRSVYVCADATVDGTAWYLTAGGWTTDADTPCTNRADVLCTLGCEWFDTLWDYVWAVTDPPSLVTCPLLITLAPIVDSLPTSEVLYIDPATGDLFVGGHVSPDDLFWDCPPYYVGY